MGAERPDKVDASCWKIGSLLWSLSNQNSRWVARIHLVKVVHLLLKVTSFSLFLSKLRSLSELKAGSKKYMHFLKKSDILYILYPIQVRYENWELGHIGLKHLLEENWKFSRFLSCQTLCENWADWVEVSFWGKLKAFIISMQICWIKWC